MTFIGLQSNRERRMTASSGESAEYKSLKTPSVFSHLSFVPLLLTQLAMKRKSDTQKSQISCTNTELTRECIFLTLTVDCTCIAQLYPRQLHLKDEQLATRHWAPRPQALSLVWDLVATSINPLTTHTHFFTHIQLGYASYWLHDGKH